MTSEIKPGISRKAFWDVDFNAIDFEENSLMVMEKVLNFGTWEDVRALFAWYGRERIKKDIVLSADLRKDTISFLCLLLKIQPSTFKCYNTRQSQNLHWSY